MKTVFIMFILMISQNGLSQHSSNIFLDKIISPIVSDDYFFKTNFEGHDNEILSMNERDTIVFKERIDSNICYLLVREVSGFRVIKKELMAKREFELDKSLNLITESLYTGKVKIKEWNYKLTMLIGSSEFDYTGKKIVEAKYNQGRISELKSTKLCKNKISSLSINKLTIITISNNLSTFRFTYNNNVLVLIEQENKGSLIQQKGSFKLPTSSHDLMYGKIESLDGFELTGGVILVNGVQVN